MIAELFVRDIDEAERTLATERSKLVEEIAQLWPAERTSANALQLKNLGELLDYVNERLAYIASTREEEI